MIKSQLKTKASKRCKKFIVDVKTHQEPVESEYKNQSTQGFINFK